ncbi:MAG: oligosaccharide repeat unit polymerase family protein [Methanobacteriaceae archaeon]|nr:oligosaccharide repeat unit polymerase family protein [Methanobacteriaceae archaeon]
MSFLKKFEKLDLFHPFIIVFITIIFLLIAIPSWTIMDELVPPSIKLYIYITIGLLFFILGVLFIKFLLDKSEFGSKIKTNKNKEITSKLSLSDKYSKNELIIISIVIIAIILQIINIVRLGGIPLFSSELKARAASKIWLISYILFLPSINILLAKFNRKSHYILLIIGLALFALTGYRTTPIAILLSSFITLYYTRDFKLKYQIIFVIIIALLLVIIGFIAVNAIGTQHWRLNALELVSYRAGFTLKILERAINRQLITAGALFYGTLTGFIFSIDPRVLVGEAVLSYSHSTTSTIFGPALLDFGIVGMIIQMFLIGAFLKVLHFLQKHKFGIITAIYGVILAQTLIWIETGPTDLVVWIFYLVGIIILIKTLYSLKVSED